LGKDFSPLTNCGETWEISGVKGNVSKVKNGLLQGRMLSDLISEFKGKLVGEKVYKQNGDEFPLLVKFIDANEDLSVQVHPDDELAKKRHNSLGKTEMWYILQADPHSTLISGFNQTVTKETYLEKLNSGKLFDILNKENASAGDCFYLPAGRVHTIGKGLLLAEVQQSSDITYRIYDFDRVDDKGNKRELHTEEALDAIDYKKYDTYKSPYINKFNELVPLAESKYFKTGKLALNTGLYRDYSGLDSFVILIGVEGKGKVVADKIEYHIQFGECLLIPAEIKKITIIPEGNLTLLESYVP
jgi:mannose-6-phosphate isomerase